MAKVTALEWHTYNGKKYNIGDSYDAPDDIIESLKIQGKAALSDPAGAAKAKDKASAKAAKPAKGARKTGKAKSKK